LRRRINTPLATNHPSAVSATREQQTLEWSASAMDQRRTSPADWSRQLNVFYLQQKKTEYISENKHPNAVMSQKHFRAVSF